MSKIDSAKLAKIIGIIFDSLGVDCETGIRALEICLNAGRTMKAKKDAEIEQLNRMLKH